MISEAFNDIGFVSQDRSFYFGDVAKTYRLFLVDIILTPILLHLWPQAYFMVIFSLI